MPFYLYLFYSNRDVNLHKVYYCIHEYLDPATETMNLFENLL